MTEVPGAAHLAVVQREKEVIQESLLYVLCLPVWTTPHRDLGREHCVDSFFQLVSEETRRNRLPRLSYVCGRQVLGVVFGAVVILFPQDVNTRYSLKVQPAHITILRTLLSVLVPPFVTVDKLSEGWREGRFVRCCAVERLPGCAVITHATAIDEATDDALSFAGSEDDS
ncbi:hypothetical protein [Microbacterium sp. GCS4]|uniref:hypothetical protein n=1 Tax=Microbacterium sp. GCS4 TaxID=1692239 RepID=UPI00128EA12D|nr:hypothetical protein [Microbacterium sp. GCS4]